MRLNGSIGIAFVCYPKNCFLEFFGNYMILTVTLNSAIDEVLVIDQFLSDQDQDIKVRISCVGGKGLDCSVTLSQLEVETTGLTFLAGENGKKLKRLVRKYGIHPEVVWTEGETRVCYVISEARLKHISHLKANALLINETHVVKLKSKLKRCLNDADWTILAGSLPAGLSPSIYGELTEISHRAKVPVLIDCWGKALLDSLQQHPEIIKMNLDEYNQTFGQKVKTITDLRYNVGPIILKNQINALVITCGEDGIFAQKQDRIYYVRVPNQQIQNAAGAGDAASAALVWRLSEGDDWSKALHWAGAVSAASVLTQETGLVRLQDVNIIFPLVTVIETD